MASRADCHLHEQWNRQQDDEDHDHYLSRIGDPPSYICEANQRSLREAEEEGGVGGEGKGDAGR
jgi:hypothetical protein